MVQILIRNHNKKTEAIDRPSKFLLGIQSSQVSVCFLSFSETDKKYGNVSYKSYDRKSIHVTEFIYTIQSALKRISAKMGKTNKHRMVQTQ